jgi:hypothetical protein
MDRLFLDANILFSAAYRPGTGLLRLWELKDALLCSSRYALEEARINLAEEDQRTRLTSCRGWFVYSMRPTESFREGFPCPREMCR